MATSPTSPAGDDASFGFGPIRNLSLPDQVAAAGGIAAWNDKFADMRRLNRIMTNMCQATNLKEALEEIAALKSLGDNHDLWAYLYMRFLYAKSVELYYAVLLKKPKMLLPVVYTPTVGEACQKFGNFPILRRGCYVSLKHKGNVKAVLEEYAAAELTKKDGKYLCDFIVFSDGGRILGLGDLGTWGMGIPIGKLDLYTACGGINPYHTMPVIIDVGCGDAMANADHLVIRDHPKYTGLKQDRKKHTSAAGTLVNTEYFEKNSIIEEFMQAAVDLFGKEVLLQFEDFNSNDAFPLLNEYRNKFLCYNDDIQGTAAIAVAGLMGAVKLRKPECNDLIAELRKSTFLFHGAGSANIGTMELLHHEAGVPKEQLMATNSRGLIWVSEDGKEGNYRNDEQKEFGVVGKPDFDISSLSDIIKNRSPQGLIGAVGIWPNCFDKHIIETLCDANPSERPCVFSMSNPKSKAEITAEDCYKFSKGRAIFGSGTAFDPCDVNGQDRHPSQVNNVYIFPGISFGARACHAKTIPERFFMVGAEAVANSLDENDIKSDRILPSRDKLREVALNVATAVVLEAQKMGIADRILETDVAALKSHLKKMMWMPGEGAWPNHEEA